MGGVLWVRESADEPRPPPAKLPEATPPVRHDFASRFRIWNEFLRNVCGVPAKLENQLAKFLRQQRGGMTYARFSKKLGLPPSTLHRLEQAIQSITLRGLQQIMRRLKCGRRDIFSDR